MQTSLQRIVTGGCFFLTTIVGATLGYMIHGWSFLDALYMVIITIFGVGFGEVNPIDTPALRTFTILVIVCGTTSAIYIVGGFIQMLTEGEIKKVLVNRRMNKEIEALKNHVIICGFGRIGHILANKLAQGRQSFVLIDNLPLRVTQAEEKGYLIIEGNATDENILEKAGIKKAKILATVLPDDALNIYITLAARELNPQITIIARGELPSTEKKLRLAGANQVVLPASIGAERMAHMITHPSAIDFLQAEEGRKELNDLLSQLDLQLEELIIALNSPFVDQPLSQMEIKGQGAFIVVAIRRANGEIITHPSHSLILAANDIVIIMGHKGDLPQFARRYNVKREMRYRGASF